MSRAGKPTDNPVNEALNGWIKEELMVDFNLGELRWRPDIEAAIEKYVKYYNNQRPCFALGYDTPANFRRRFYKGEIPKKDTFENRILTETPKFLLKRHKTSETQSDSNKCKLSEMLLCENC